MKHIELDNAGGIARLTELAAPLTYSDVKSAVQEFNDENGNINSYSDSTGYDLVVDNMFYPPKAIFGLALSKLTGEEILSSHFKGGLKSACFNTLKRLGFDIVKKTKREDETFIYSNFKVGDSYSKLDCMAKSGVRTPRQARDISGVTRFKNCVVLFVTLDKQDKEEAHKYYDTFLLDGQQFHWESQNNNTTDTPHMKMIFNNQPVILFVRIRQKIKSKTQPFTYVGQLSYIEHQYTIDNNETPVEVLFDVSDYQEPASPKLSAIYLWESEEQSELGYTFVPNLLKKVRTSGQGRMVDAKKKKAIELHAMDMARKHYESLNYEVVDTSSNRPYDLECFRSNKFRRIEVKGTMSKGDSVYVTSGEVIDAISSECETDLFIVCNIQMNIPKKGQYDTSGGDIRLTENWKPDNKDLEPKTYKYTVQ